MSPRALVIGLVLAAVMWAGLITLAALSGLS